MSNIQLTKLRKRRGVIRALITRLEKRIRELEGISDQPNTPDHARELASNMESLAAEFKEYHFELVDKIEESEDALLEREQDILDEQSDLISDLNIRLRRLTLSGSDASNNPAKLASRNLAHLKKNVHAVHESIF